MAQDQRKATKQCDQKIFLIKEPRELSQLNKIKRCQQVSKCNGCGTLTSPMEKYIF